MWLLVMFGATDGTCSAVAASQHRRRFGVRKERKPSASPGQHIESCSVRRVVGTLERGRKDSWKFLALRPPLFGCSQPRGSLLRDMLLRGIKAWNWLRVRSQRTLPARTSPEDLSLQIVNIARVRMCDTTFWSTDRDVHLGCERLGWEVAVWSHTRFGPRLLPNTAVSL